MTFYRLLHPILISIFGGLVFILKRLPSLNTALNKIVTTWDIRSVDGRPAFQSIHPAIFGGEKPIWIHAASGEFEYAKPVIREIVKKWPQSKVLVTYFSPTYALNVRKFPGVTASCPLPLDSARDIHDFLRHLNPSCLLIARTDTWPNTIREVSKAGLPTLLFSTTFHEGSKRTSWVARRITRQTLALLSQIQCVSDDDKKMLNEMGLTSVEVAGDTRYDQVLSRLLAEKTPMVTAQIAAIKSVIHERSFTAGSVWSEDLDPVLRASAKIQGKTTHTLILVPHEISESFLMEMESRAYETGFKKDRVARLSRLSNAKAPVDLLIVDTVGLLAELYLLSEVAFVGGSFRKTVHSVMEPLAAGCLTLVGPLHTNNREAIEFQTLKLESDSWPFVKSVKDPSEFTVALEFILKRGQEPTARAAAAKQIEAAVFARGGATADVLKWLQRSLRLTTGA